MSISSAYPGYPEKKFIRHFRNALLQLRKTIQSSKDIDELKLHMEHFINANRRVVWPHHTSEVFHKDEAEKAVQKVVTEFQRYTQDLQLQKSQKSYQDLLDALFIVESMIDRLKEGV